MSEGDALSLSKFNAANIAVTTTSTDNNADQRRISHPNLGSAFSHDESEDGVLFDDGGDDEEDDDDASYYGQTNDYDTPRGDTTTTTVGGDPTAAAATAIAAIAFTSASSTAATTTPRTMIPTTSTTADFDLCGSMWKRRGGLGRNAERKWVIRAFTLKGSRLNYHEESEFDSITYISKPRATLDLSKVETIAEMHSKQKRGAPSSDLLTINIYDPIVHAKRKWEMCCMSKEQQLLWYRAIKAYDGKPVMGGGGAASPHSPMDVGGGGGGGAETRERTNSLPSPVLHATTINTSLGRTPSFPSLTLTPAAVPMKSTDAAATAATAATTMKSVDDVDFIARVAAKAVEIILAEQSQKDAMSGGGIVNLFDGTIISLAAILNFVIYIARHETLYMTWV